MILGLDMYDKSDVLNGPYSCLIDGLKPDSKLVSFYTEESFEVN